MTKPFIPVNELLARTRLEQFIEHYNFPTEIKRKGNEERISNPFACEKCVGNKQVVSVNWQSGVFTSHCYHCNVRGRVTALLFGMKYGRQPAGGTLKGEEFKDIAADIAQVAGHTSDVLSTPTPTPEPSPPPKPEIPERKVNLPLARNPDERIARLEHLSDELIRDPAEMSGRAQSYLASRPYMTTEAMEKWDVGCLRSNSKSMLRSKFVYALRNERSEKIGYVGRDLAFNDKLAKWENSDRTGKAPIKAKFPPGFARGSFLYGAEVSRLETEEARSQLKDIGVLVVEGMNDCIALDQLGILSVALCSNRIAEGQMEKLIRWSKSLTDGKITLMLDNDKEGWVGMLDTLQKLAPHAHVATVWSPDSHGGKYRGQQPEQLTAGPLLELLSPLSANGAVLKQIKDAH